MTLKHTIALNGNASESERQAAFERLAMNEDEATDDNQPLDYIFSVEILNEGVDIVEVTKLLCLDQRSPQLFLFNNLDEVCEKPRERNM